MPLWTGALLNLLAKARTADRTFRLLLRAHFETDPQTLPIVTESFDPNEQPNLHLAMEGYLKQGGRSAELLGVSGGSDYPGISLSRLVGASGSSPFEPAPGKGPVEYVNVPLDEEVLACVQRGFYLVRDGDQRSAVLIRGPSEIGYPPKLQVEVLGRTKEAAEALLAELRGTMRARNVYRGRVLSFERREHGMGFRILFHRLPRIERQQIIFPDGLLERIERQTVLFARHSARLLAAGRHLKRGILLYGRPGTGKTLTAMYLANQMRDRTVFLMAGFDFGWLSQTCQMARALQPSVVILEDVDLIAEDRSRPGCVSPFLFELLNQMDGLAEDTDVVFLLTTNRVEILEPALAARPGRVDQALELPLPDPASRRRLFELYGQGLVMQVNELDLFIERTEGASAAFIRELLRKAALFAAEESGDRIAVQDRHLDEALRELVVYGGDLTRALLGAEVRAPNRPN